MLMLLTLPFRRRHEMPLSSCLRRVFFRRCRFRHAAAAAFDFAAAMLFSFDAVSFELLLLMAAGLFFAQLRSFSPFFRCRFRCCRYITPRY